MIGNPEVVVVAGPLIQPDPTLGGKGSLPRADQIVLISDPPGPKVYINTGAVLSSGPSHGSRPADSTPPPAP
jgi:hypothetical protein